MPAAAQSRGLPLQGGEDEMKLEMDFVKAEGRKGFLS